MDAETRFYILFSCPPLYDCSYSTRSRWGAINDLPILFTFDLLYACCSCCNVQLYIPCEFLVDPLRSTCLDYAPRFFLLPILQQPQTRTD